MSCNKIHVSQVLYKSAGHATPQTQPASSKSCQESWAHTGPMILCVNLSQIELFSSSCPAQSTHRLHAAGPADSNRPRNRGNNKSRRREPKVVRDQQATAAGEGGAGDTNAAGGSGTQERRAPPGKHSLVHSLHTMFASPSLSEHACHELFTFCCTQVLKPFSLS